MDVYLSGGQRVRLGPNDLLGQGGEGAVYAAGAHAYKVYHDPARAMPAAKVAELAAIQDPRAVAPADLLFDASKTLIGYRMALASGKTVCEVMTRAFRTRRGLGQDAYHKVVEDLQGAVASIHRAGVVLVDLNDLNVLVEGDSVRIIDLDSAQTPSYCATALQVLVRDPLATGPRFSPGSDWYAFAILAFELFCGAHPFRGAHPGAATIAERMRLGLSALDPLARLPPAAYPLSGIPQSYRGWMEAVLSNKCRDAPTLGTQFAFVILPSAPAPLQRPGTGQLRAQVLLHLPGRVLRVWGVGSRLVSLLEDGRVFLDAAETGFRLPRGAQMVAGGSRRDATHAFACYVEGGMLRAHDLVSSRPVQCGLGADEVATAGNMILYRQQDAINELVPVVGIRGASAGAKRVGNCMPRSTRMGDGSALQIQLKTLVLSLFSESGRTREIPLPELEGYKPLDVWATGSVAAIRAAKGKRVDRVVVRVRADGTHSTQIEKDRPDDLDLARTAAGVVADRCGDALRLWKEADETGHSVLLDLPAGDIGPLADHQGFIVAPAGSTVVRLRSA